MQGGSKCFMIVPYDKWNHLVTLVGMVAIVGQYCNNCQTHRVPTLLRLSSSSPTPPSSSPSSPSLFLPFQCDIFLPPPQTLQIDHKPSQTSVSSTFSSSVLQCHLFRCAISDRIFILSLSLRPHKASSGRHGGGHGGRHGGG